MSNVIERISLFDRGPPGGLIPERIGDCMVPYLRTVAGVMPGSFRLCFESTQALVGLGEAPAMHAWLGRNTV
jgi:hypothetical protein